MASARANAERQVTAAEQSLGRKMQTAGRRLTSVGSSMTRHISLPAAAAAGASIKLAIDFEDSMEKIRNLVGANQKQIDEWSAQLLELGPKLGKSPQELADALYFVASSGIKAADAMDVVTISAKASALGLGETEQVADAVTSAMNAYRKSHLSAADATNVLAAAVKFGKGESDEIAKSIGRVIPVASKLKVPFNDVGASIASMTLQGLDAAEATTALRSIFLATLKPTTDSEKALKSVGLSAEDLRDSLAEKGTLATLQMLSDKFKGNEEQIARIFPNVRALVGAFNLTGDSAKRNSKIFDEMSQKTRLVQVGFQNLQKTDAQKLRRSLAGLQAAGIEIGEKLLPALVGIADNVADVVTAFAGMPDFAKELLIGAIVVGPLVRAAGAFLTIAGAVTRIAQGEAALSVLGMTKGGAAGVGAGAAGTAAGGAAAGGIMGRLRGALGKGGKVLGVALAADIVLSTVDEVKRQSEEHSDDFQTAIGALAGKQDESTIGGFMKTYTKIGPGLLTETAKKAQELKHALDMAAVYKRVTPAQAVYLKQLGREVGLTREARAGLGHYLDTIKKFPIGGGPIDWLHHLGDLQEAAMVGSDKTRKAMLKMAEQALHSGQISLAEFGRLKTTISADSNTLAHRWGRAMDTLGPAARKAAKESSEPITTAIKGLRNQYGNLTTAGAHMSKSQRDDWKDLASAAFNNGEITVKQLDKIDRAMTDSREKWSDNLKKIADRTGESTKAVRKSVGLMDVNVSKDYDHMVTVSVGGMTWLTSKTSEAAQKLGVKQDIAFKANPAARHGAGGHGIRNNQAGGMTAMGLVPGYGTGDKIPVHVGGQPVAMTEPGEVFAVLHREAAKEFMSWNRIPRYQGGGMTMIDPSWDPGSERLNAVISPTVGAWEKRYRTDMTAGYDPGGGHVSPGHNLTGTATDMVPGSGGSWDTLEAGLRAVVGKIPQVIYGPQWVPGTMALDNHGRGLHAHLEWGMDPKAGAAMQQLQRLILSPALPMSAPGQGALDVVHDAGQQYLNRLLAKMGGDAGTGMSIDGPVQAAFAKVARSVSRSKTATLALGEAGYAESGMEDLPGGDGSSSGALQLLASTAQALGIDPHNEGQIGTRFFTGGYASSGGANALAARGLPAHLVAQGVQGSAFSSGSNYADQIGPAQSWMHRYRLAKGGGFKINPFLAGYSKIHKRGRRHKRLGNLLDRLRDVGVPGKVTDQIKHLDRDAAIYADLAERASSLTGDDAIPAKVFGPGGMLDQAGWLGKELGSLWPLRNQLIKAKQAMDSKQAKIDHLLKQAQKAQHRLKGTMRKASRRIKHLHDKDKLTPEDRRRLEVLHGKGLTHDEEKRLAYLEQKKHLTDHEREQLRKLTRHKLTKTEREELRKLGKKETLSGKERRELRHLESSQEPRHLRMQALNKLIPVLHSQHDKLGAIDSGWSDRLDEVQGIGSPMERINRLRSPTDNRFGGELLDVQLALRDLAHPSGASDAAALDIAGLVEFSRLVRVGAFETAPFMGAHAKGGVALVGETGAELAHFPDGTRIHNPEDTRDLLSPTLDATIFAEFSVGGEVIDKRVRGTIKRIEVEQHGQVRADVRGY